MAAVESVLVCCWGDGVCGVLCDRCVRGGGVVLCGGGGEGGEGRGLGGGGRVERGEVWRGGAGWRGERCGGLRWEDWCDGGMGRPS